MQERTIIGVTLGDPSGVGPEVIVKAFAESALHEESKLFVVGAIQPIERAIAQAGLSQSVRSIKIPSDANSSSECIDVFELDEIQDTDFPMGVLSEKSARASHAWVEAATHLALAGSVDAITTAPVNKEAWRLAGFSDKGHQEVFQRLTGADYVATMLVSGPLRCMHLSTHLSLSEACDYVTKENVLRAINLTHEYFIRWGVAAPRIGIAALNPHASDGGLIGETEENEILPAVVMAQAAGIDAIGPVPADTVFNQAIDGLYDVVLVMYHDQGHIPIKVYGFENSITVNLGIPIFTVILFLKTHTLIGI